MMKKRTLLFIVLFIIGLIIISAVVYIFLFTRECNSEECFIVALRKCQRAEYTSESEGNVWHYSIKPDLGISKTCNVAVKNIAISSQDEIAKKVQGKSMICKIPKEYAGTYTQVHQKLEYCSGPLKEALQDVIIDRFYKYIIQNIGEITEEVRNI